MSPASRPSPTTILIVEHEALIRVELRCQLEDLGHIVLEASNADEAILMLDRHQDVGVLLTDVRMPGTMDGLRLARHVRDRWPPVKIIVSSGSGDACLTDLPKGSRLLPKPYGPEKLEGLLANLGARART